MQGRKTYQEKLFNSFQLSDRVPADKFYRRLGTLINFLAMKRVNTRGIKLANKCMIMAAIAYNLKKMLKFRKEKVIEMTASVLTKEMERLNSIINYFCFPKSESW